MGIIVSLFGALFSGAAAIIGIIGSICVFVFNLVLNIGVSIIHFVIELFR